MKKNAIPPAAPYLIIPIGIAAVSTASIFIRFAQNYAPSITIAAFRMGIAALLLLPYTLIKHKIELRALSRRDYGFALLAGFLLAVHFGTWITSLEYTSVASSVVLVTTTPLWVSLMAPIFLREKSPGIAVLGMLVALVGGVIVAGSDVCSWLPGGISCDFENGFSGSKSLIGDLLAVIGAISAAIYIMIGNDRQTSTTKNFLNTLCLPGLQHLGPFSGDCHVYHGRGSTDLSKPGIWLVNLVGSCASAPGAFHIQLVFKVFTCWICVYKPAWRTDWIFDFSLHFSQ